MVAAEARDAEAFWRTEMGRVAWMKEPTKIKAVDFTGDVPVLTVGSRRVAITDVTDVRIPDVTAPDDDA